jgi:antitoxin (DNA-binding transcriptional repressor) of toxin-antitoxin stability system
MQYSLSEAMNKLSKLAQDTLAGEDVVIARNGIPLVQVGDNQYTSRHA